MVWNKISVSIKGNGEKTITYNLEGTCINVQSRKRNIPHANGEGYWSFTSYFVQRGAYDVSEKNSLKDAKEYAEKIAKENQ